jgi:sugar lactone lactonase YvrE
MQIDCVLEVRENTEPKGECPVWSAAEQCLYWVDIDAGTLNRFDPATGRNIAYALGEPIGCYGLRRAGGFLLATRSGVHLSGADPTQRTRIAAPEPDKPENRPNDGRCDPQGRFWFGTMCDPPTRSADPQGALYRVDPDGSVTRMVDGIFIGNGLAFSPDGRTLYHSDSFTAVRTIWAWDLDAEGRITNRRVFATTHGLQGRPDGACVDADGCYWSCHIDGGLVVRYTPDGRIDRTIPMPVKWPTMCAFGGAKLDTLYITSLRRGGAAGEDPDQSLAGSLFACRPGVTGVPEPLFGG